MIVFNFDFDLSSYQQMEKSANSIISIKDEELNQMKLR